MAVSREVEVIFTVIPGGGLILNTLLMSLHGYDFSKIHDGDPKVWYF